jgi:hypothetical protein
MKHIIIKLIKIYQLLFSLDHSFWAKNKNLGVCRHYPTCSQYTIEAIDRFGIIKGLFWGGKRILKCNPFFKGGYDPVPEKR